jgi:hypothetical protein
MSLRRPNGLMKWQLWRLQDLRDGGGLGFTTELFFPLPETTFIDTFATWIK